MNKIQLISGVYDRIEDLANYFWIVNIEFCISIISMLALIIAKNSDKALNYNISKTIYQLHRAINTLHTRFINNKNL